MTKKILQRRDFLKTAAAVGTGLIILPGGVLSGRNAQSNKLNIGLIGAGGRGQQHWRALSDENIVALCDVDENALALAAKEFPNAKQYIDWRKCLDQSDLDAVVCCTTDFTHAFVANWAINRGLHVYCEKPLGITVEEVRTVRENYLRNRNKLATQHGTQRHAFPNFNRVRELIIDGAIGTLEAAHAFGNRQIPKPGYLPALGNPPDTFHFDLWLGPTPDHPYNPEYFGNHEANPGTNCLNWNMYWDFGVGQIGDMGAHTMDLAWNAIDADFPTSIEATGDPFNPEVTPVEMTAVLEHPANDWRPAIQVTWYQGGAMPENSMRYIDLDAIGHGVLFKGSRGFLAAGFQSRALIPFGDEADMTYYRPRSEDELIPDMGNFQKEWIDACKGDLKTSCDFEYGSEIIENMLLGLVAYRVGQKIDYDGTTGRITNIAEANDDRLMRRTYREGWTLDG
ncbi:Gfo/Idh/MocA family oxidoreductase [bacterium]|nr:Gfo/Idh/MocA family oxidoreductase [bacterium]RQV93799.1 MAG: gfo/Idh/MocA family oxidoreductase [bacterium]